MKKGLQRFLAYVLSLALVLSLVVVSEPTTVEAADSYTISDSATTSLSTSSSTYYVIKCTYNSTVYYLYDNGENAVWTDTLSSKCVWTYQKKTVNSISYTTFYNYSTGNGVFMTVSSSWTGLWTSSSYGGSVISASSQSGNLKYTSSGTSYYVAYTNGSETSGSTTYLSASTSSTYAAKAYKITFTGSDPTVLDEDVVSYTMSSLTVSNSLPALGDTITLTASVSYGTNTVDSVPDGYYVSYYYVEGTSTDATWTKIAGDTSYLSYSYTTSTGNGFVNGTTYTFIAVIHDSSWSTKSQATTTVTISGTSDNDTAGYTIKVTLDDDTPDIYQKVTATVEIYSGEEKLDALPDGYSLEYYITDSDKYATKISTTGAWYTAVSSTTDLSSWFFVVSAWAEKETKYTLQVTLYSDTTSSTWVQSTYTTVELTTTSNRSTDADGSEGLSSGTLSDDFMTGMDFSEFYTNWVNGSVYKDYEGNEYAYDTDDKTSEETAVEFFTFLKETCGVNWVRLRVWNDPYASENAQYTVDDTTVSVSKGDSYGAGTCDLAIAKTVGAWASAAGIQVLIDFHYSDFWADPSKQSAPKAWASMNITEKSEALYTYTYDSLKELIDAGVDVAMVQVGNETNGSFCGELAYWVTGGSTEDYASSETWSNICTLFSSGSSAVRKVAEDTSTDIKVVLHFTNPNASNPTWYASLLADAEVDYDIMGISYYMYWHGEYSTLLSQINTLKETYNKDCIIAETAYPWTYDNFDDMSNAIASDEEDPWDGFSYHVADYTVSQQGQLAAMTGLLDTISSVESCLGLFYWSSAWTANDAAECGWATAAASEYDEDVNTWGSGGNNYDNQCLWDDEGNPVAALAFFAEYEGNHVWIEKTDEDGNIQYECASCGIICKHESCTLDTESNDYVAATCSQAGTNVYVCNECGYTYTEASEKAEHTSVDVEEVKATCIAKGTAAGKKCSVCGETLEGCTETDVDSSNHTNVVSVDAITATCGTKELNYAEGTYCNDCEKYVTGGDTSAAAETHTWTTGADKSVCTVCGEECTHSETCSKDEDADGYKEPTCTQTGLYVYKCSECGYTYNEVIPVVAHSAVDVEEVPATCVEKGTTAGTKCEVCETVLSGCEEIAIDSTNHAGEISYETTPATCTAKGYTTCTCNACNESYTTDETDMIDHDYDTGQEQSTSSCGIVIVYSCKNCDAQKTESTDKTEHTSVVADAAVDATCKSTGLTAGSHCEACDTVIEAQVVTEIDSTNHVNTEEKDEIIATCGTEEKSYAAGTYCNDCGTYTSGGEESEAATEHTWTEDEEQNVDGYTTYTCSVCSATNQVENDVTEEPADPDADPTDPDATPEDESTSKTALTQDILDEIVNALSSVSFEDATTLADVTLPTSQYGTYSWADSSDTEVATGSYTVIFTPNEDTEYDWSVVETYDATTGSIALSIDVTVTKTETVAEVTAPTFGDTFSADGVDYIVTNAEGTEVAVASVSDSTITDLVIPDTVTDANGNTYKVTSILSGACKNNTSLKTVTIGNNVTEIGDSAFEGCTDLTTIHIGDAVTTISAKALKGCTKLQTVTGCKNVTTIAKQAFANDKALVSVAGCTKVKTIGASAFSKCTKLTTIGKKKNVITLPSIVKIAKKAFFKCTSIKKVKATSKKLVSIGNSAFQGCKSLKNFISKSKVLKKIGKKAFFKCKKLAKVKLKTTKLTSKNVLKKAFKGIKATCSFKVPKAKKADYKKLFKSRGAKSTIKVS